jgi:hypothetical protein
MEDQVQILIKERFSCHNNEVYRLIKDNNELVTGSIRKVARYIYNNDELLEMITVNINGDEINLPDGWRYANEEEAMGCIRLSKLYSGYEPAY